MNGGGEGERRNLAWRGVVSVKKTQGMRAESSWNGWYETGMDANFVASKANDRGAALSLQTRDSNLLSTIQL